MPSAATSGGLVSASAAASSSASVAAARRSSAADAGCDASATDDPLASLDHRRIGRRGGAAQQVVVEVVAMERCRDLVRDAGGAEPLREPAGGRTARRAGVGEDRDAPDVGRPLPPGDAVRRERRPDRHTKDCLRSEGRLDALCNAKMAVVAEREQPNRAVRHRAQHLLACRRLARSVLEQEGAMDAAHHRTVGAARDGDDAGPAARAVVVGQIGMVEEIGGGRVREAAAAQVGLSRAAGERHAAVEDAADLQGVVDLRPDRHWPRRRPIDARE